MGIVGRAGGAKRLAEMCGLDRAFGHRDGDEIDANHISHLACRLEHADLGIGLVGKNLGLCQITHPFGAIEINNITNQQVIGSDYGGLKGFRHLQIPLGAGRGQRPVLHGVQGQER